MIVAHRVKETLLPRGFLPPPRHGFKNRTHHPTRRRRALRSHPESLDSNHRLSPRSLHKTMSGPGEKGHSGRPGPKNPEFASSASFGGDDKAPHPPGAMKCGVKRGVRAKPTSAPTSAPPRESGRTYARSRTGTSQCRTTTGRTPRPSHASRPPSRAAFPPVLQRGDNRKMISSLKNSPTAPVAE